MAERSKCGFVAIVGRVNVGKSTLFNALLGEQLSITTHKPQTTRHNIRGVLSQQICQLILIDTPGVQFGNRRLINKVLINNAISSLHEVDIILMLVELDHWKEEEDFLVNQMKQINRPVVLAINKIDKIKDKIKLLPIMESIKSKHAFTSIVPISALHDKEFDDLQNELCSLSPESEFLFPRDMKWDRDDKFIISEIIRGSAMMHLEKELPYAIYTEIENVEFAENLININAIIWVEKDSQKPIVIGKKGLMLKAIGEQARLRLEKVFNQKVMLNTWVKVKSHWQDQQSVVSQFENK